MARMGKKRSAYRLLVRKARRKVTTRNIKIYVSGYHEIGSCEDLIEWRGLDWSGSK
jgi:hypothetical protein